MRRFKPNCLKFPHHKQMGTNRNMWVHVTNTSSLRKYIIEQWSELTIHSFEHHHILIGNL